jgi:hypothetical protein
VSSRVMTKVDIPTLILISVSSVLTSPMVFLQLPHRGRYISSTIKLESCQYSILKKYATLRSI